MSRAATHSSQFRRERDAIRAWLGRPQWTHFVTLALNEPAVSVGRVRNRLYRWDALMNHALIGGSWQKRPDERMQWFAFLESPVANPHWHLCVEVLQGQIGRLRDKDPLARDAFSDVVQANWRKLVPSGTSDVQLYRDAGVVDYITKNAHRRVTYANFISSMEFIRR